MAWFREVAARRIALCLLTAGALAATLACAVDAAEIERPSWPEVVDCMHYAAGAGGEHYPRGEVQRASYFTTMAQKCGAWHADSRDAALARLPESACGLREFRVTHPYASDVLDSKYPNTLAGAYVGYVCAERDFDAFAS